MQKLIRITMMWALTAGLLAAQAAPAKSGGKTPPASTSAMKPSAPAKTPAKAAPAKAAPAKAAAAKPAPAKSVPVHKPVAKPVPHPVRAKAAIAAVPKKPAAASKGKRDPFVNPVRADGGPGEAKCTNGPKCLIIAQIVLKGTIKTKEGMIAMVENAARKEYNLRENDEVSNGVVVKITGDSIVFRENLRDLLGNTSTRDVVKRVTVPAI